MHYALHRLALVGYMLHSNMLHVYTYGTLLYALRQTYEVTSTKFVAPQEYFKYDRTKHRERLRAEAARQKPGDEEDTVAEELDYEDDDETVHDQSTEHDRDLYADEDEL